MLYDLHMHSCLSPCAEDDMTPANIAGLAKLAGAELIAVTDHNAADNLPAVQRCCNAYGPVSYTHLWMTSSGVISVSTLPSA